MVTLHSQGASVVERGRRRRQEERKFMFDGGGGKEVQVGSEEGMVEVTGKGAW